MEEFAYWTGLSFLGGLGLLLAVIAVFVALDWIGARRHNKRILDIWEAKKELGSDLITASHWFSECPKTAGILKEMGEKLITNGNFDTSRIRDQWRGES